MSNAGIHSKDIALKKQSLHDETKGLDMKNIQLAELGLIDPPPDEAWSKNDKPAPLELPPKRKFDLPEGCKAHGDEPLQIRYITDMDWAAFTLNLLTAVILFCLMFFVISFKTHNPVARVGIPLSVIWVAVICLYGHLWTTVKGLQAKLYLDYVVRELIIYPKGFHWTSWFSRDQGIAIDFQKHEVINTNGTDEPKMDATTQDGYQTAAEVTIIYNWREDGLNRSLKFKEPEEIRVAIREWVEARWSDIAGCNSYETLLYYKAEVKAWIDNLLGGDEHLSPLEEKTGTEIKLIMGNFSLTGESQKTFDAKARLGLIREETKKLVDDCDVKPNVAFEGTQVALDLIEKTVNIQKYEGIPERVHTFAPGSGFAITGKGK